MTYIKKLSPEQALQKARHYCGYQERSHGEVREKLYGFGLYKNQVESLLATLIEEDYLNEERFAKQYAGGHFRQKQWGRVKIRQGLLARRVSAYNIKRAMQEIDEEEYLAVLHRLAAKKWASVKGVGTNRYTRLAKTTSFLLQRGFEPDLVRQSLQRLAGD